MTPTEADFLRTAQLISYGLPLAEIHDRLIASGLTEEGFYLCYAAARRLVAASA